MHGLRQAPCRTMIMLNSRDDLARKFISETFRIPSTRAGPFHMIVSKIFSAISHPFLWFKKQWIDPVPRGSESLEKLLFPGCSSTCQDSVYTTKENNATKNNEDRSNRPDHRRWILYCIWKEFLIKFPNA